MRNLTFCRIQKAFFHELVSFCRNSAPTTVVASFFICLLLGWVIFPGGVSAEATEVAQAMMGNDASISQSNARDFAAVDHLNRNQRVDFVCDSTDGMYDSRIIDQSGKAVMGCRDIAQDPTLVSAERLRQALLFLSCAFVVYFLWRVCAEENVRTGLRGNDIAEAATRNEVKLAPSARPDSLSFGYGKSFRSRV